MSIPKPAFASCDETSIKLKTEYKIKEGESLFIQCKKPSKDNSDWSNALEIPLKNQDSIALADIVDLEPGTAYFVRLMVKKEDGSVEYGQETVFDTKPIDCTPKKETCVIC